MAFPAEPHRIFSVGDVLDPDELNDIEAAIVRAIGLGIFDAEILANGGLSATAGIDVPAGQAIRLAESPRTQIYFEDDEEIALPFCAGQWSPSDDGDVFQNSSVTGGYIGWTGVAHVACPIILPRGVQITSLSVHCEKDASDTITAVLRERNPSGGGLFDQASATTATGSGATTLILTPASPVPVQSGHSYWLNLLSTGGGSLRFYGANVHFNRPAP